MKKKILIFIMIFVTLFSVCLQTAPTTIEISAKTNTSATNKKAAKALKKWLNIRDFAEFAYLDVNNDKIKDLVVRFEGAKWFVVAMYKKGKVVYYAPDDDPNDFGPYYDKKNKKIVYAWGGCGSTYYAYYNYKKAKKYSETGAELITTSAYLEKREKINKKGISYSYYYKGKKTTKKNYNKKYKTFRKNLVNLKFHKTTKKNINKYLK